jgi:hypothetical protein
LPKVILPSAHNFGATLPPTVWLTIKRESSFHLNPVSTEVV